MVGDLGCVFLQFELVFPHEAEYHEKNRNHGRKKADYNERELQVGQCHDNGSHDNDENGPRALKEPLTDET